jgi:1-phosphofructokinase family hexose kinase
MSQEYANHAGPSPQVPQRLEKPQRPETPEQVGSVVTVTLNTSIDCVFEVPGLQVGAHLRGHLKHRTPAGKAITVSRALSILGRSSVATGFVGQHELDEFERSLQACQPGRVLCQLLALRGATRQNITLLDPEAHTDTHIREPGPKISDADWGRIRSKLRLLARPGSTFVIAGSLPPGVDPDRFAYLVRSLDQEGASVVLDIAGGLVRRTLRLDEADQPSEGEPQADDEAQESFRPKLISPNRAELASVMGWPSQEKPQPPDQPPMSIEQALEAAQWLARRVAWVVVTLGAEGALLVSQQGSWRAWAELDGPVVSTVGCGDCLLAGVLDGLLGDLEPPEALKRGVAAGSANALSDGVGGFSLETLSTIEQQSFVESVK